MQEKEQMKDRVTGRREELKMSRRVDGLISWRKEMWRTGSIRQMGESYLRYIITHSDEIPPVCFKLFVFLYHQLNIQYRELT